MLCFVMLQLCDVFYQKSIRFFFVMLAGTYVLNVSPIIPSFNFIPLTSHGLTDVEEPASAN